MRLTLVLMWNSTQREKCFFFQEFSSSINKTFILAGRLGTRLSFYEVYADDSAPYCACKSVEFVVNDLEQLSSILFEWLNNNYMKLNTG